MILYLILFFIFGSAVGSFLNVVADRIVRGESILGRSRCDHCGTTLATLDLVPIVSFIGLGAKCRYCKKPVSFQYPLVEFVTASLYSLAFYNLSLSAELGLVKLIFWLFLIAILIVVSVVDFKYYLVPTTLVYFASIVALFFNYFWLSPDIFVEHVLTAFVAAGAFLVVVLTTRGRGMGQGDIVLAFLMGMVLGVQGILVSLFLAFSIGAFVAVILIGLRRKKFGETIPFAPFLVLGFVTVLFYSEQIINFYLAMLY